MIDTAGDMLRALVTALVLLAGCSPHRDDARVGAWREDLHALATELPRRHVDAFARVTEADWRRAVDALDQRLPGLDDAHVEVELARLVAAIGDAHTQIKVVGRTEPYPLALVWFEDGIFVIGSRAEDRWAVGRKVVEVNGHRIDEVIAALTPLIPRNNEAWLHAELPGWLVDPVVLAGLDLSPIDRATFELAGTDGTVRDLELRPTGGREVAIVPPATLPLHLRAPARGLNYWNTYVAADRLIYFAYNACANDTRAGSVATFAATTLAFVDRNPVDRFVIDLRNNGGGNSELLRPLIDGLASRPALAGRVFVIIGMHTFSSAVLDAILLKTQAHATLVGGPTGGKPSSFGEVKTFELPRSHLGVQYSTKRFSFPELPNDSLEPDLPVKVFAADWFSGRDPAVDAILAAALPAR